MKLILFLCFMNMVLFLIYFALQLKIDSIVRKNMNECLEKIIEEKIFNKEKNK